MGGASLGIGLRKRILLGLECRPAWKLIQCIAPSATIGVSALERSVNSIAPEDRILREIKREIWGETSTCRLKSEQLAIRAN